MESSSHNLCLSMVSYPRWQSDTVQNENLPSLRSSLSYLLLKLSLTKTTEFKPTWHWRPRPLLSRPVHPPGPATSLPPPPALTTKRRTGQYSPFALELHAHPHAEHSGAFVSGVGFGVHSDVDSGVDSGADFGVESEVESGEAGC